MKQELIDGIAAFWSTVNINKFRKKIRYLGKVIPKVLEVEGAATGH